jgi:predicted ArsR family transcriptional regulator
VHEPSLGPARERVLRAVADAEGPVMLADLVARLGGHPNTTRQALDALVADGLVDRRTVPRATRGRPPFAFRVTDLGRRVLGGGDYAELVGAFATYLMGRGRPAEEAREVGRIWGAGRATTLPPVGTAGVAGGADSVGAVVDVLEALGFDPERLPAGTGGVSLVLRACPLLELVEQHPDVSCALHHGLVDGVLQRLGASVGVDLTPFSEPDGCRLRLSP